MTDGLGSRLVEGGNVFSVPLITRDDIVTFTSEDARVSGIKHIMDADKEEEKNLG